MNVKLIAGEVRIAKCISKCMTYERGLSVLARNETMSVLIITAKFTLADVEIMVSGLARVGIRGQYRFILWFNLVNMQVLINKEKFKAPIPELLAELVELKYRIKNEKLVICRDHV